MTRREENKNVGGWEVSRESQKKYKAKGMEEECFTDPAGGN
jgi:hypothetical protein